MSNTIQFSRGEARLQTEMSNQSSDIHRAAVAVAAAAAPAGDLGHCNTMSGEKHANKYAVLRRRFQRAFSGLGLCAQEAKRRSAG